MQKVMSAVLAASLSLSAIQPALAGWCDPNAHDVTLMPPPLSRESCGKVCIITRNGGGYIDDFLAAAKRLKREGVMLKIDGPCASACTMAADKARPNVCVTKRARMEFHKGYRCHMNITVRFSPRKFYSRDINDWVDSNGGFPGDTIDDQSMLVMDADTAQTFFKAC